MTKTRLCEAESCSEAACGDSVPGTPALTSRTVDRIDPRSIEEERSDDEIRVGSRRSKGLLGRAGVEGTESPVIRTHVSTVEERDRRDMCPIERSETRSDSDSHNILHLEEVLEAESGEATLSLPSGSGENLRKPEGLRHKGNNMWWSER